MKRTRALLDELMTATPRLSIFQRDEGRIVFVDGDGHTRTFTTDGKKERHQLKGGATVKQTFALDDAKRLVISTTLDDSRMGKVPANKSVYDRQEER